jgi:HlyD family secretion protein
MSASKAMIFVSPDESGRVVSLKVREGDQVKEGQPLFELDDDLQQADLNQNKASLANAQQVYDRALSLSKTGSGTQASLDSALATLRVAQARVNTSQTRLNRRRMAAPIDGIVQQMAKLKIGQDVRVTCDGCAADLMAKIYFIATRAEYTPPVIYSQDERSKLVYLIQARPAKPESLRVGQPVSVYVNGSSP